jgi:malonyl-CoA O-methyltransferase
VARQRIAGDRVTHFALDRHALARSFDRAGAGYDAAAQLQQRVRTELLERLQFFALEPHTILDLGAGTCQGALALRRRFARARIIALDLAPGMLKAAPRALWPRRRFERVCADACALPLASRSIDLVFSNLMLQWCDRPGLVFRELARVLKPGAVVVFSSFGPDTLKELRLAWESVDDAIHVSQFPDMQQLGDALMHAGLAEPVMDVEPQRLLYPDVHALMRELKRIGARNAASLRPRALTGRGRLQRMITAYETQRTAAGIPATFEVIFGAAFGAAELRGPQALEGHGDSASAEGYSVPLAALRRSRR